MSSRLITRLLMSAAALSMSFGTGCRKHHGEEDSFQQPLLDGLPEIPNPLRGFYDWISKTKDTRMGVTSSDFYTRFTWRDLEPSQGSYDFSKIDRILSALPTGHTFSFRISALNGCSSPHNGQDVPDYLVGGKGWWAPLTEASCNVPSAYIPDWNDPNFLTAANNFLSALGARYNGDHRIGFIDIGMFGHWGEWHVLEFPYCDSNLNSLGAELPTAASLQAIIQSHVQAFPDTQLVMMTDEKDSLLYALGLNTKIPVGMRRDSWGASIFNDATFISRRSMSGSPSPGGKCTFASSAMTDDEVAFVLNRWTKAPFIVESYGSAKAFQVGNEGIVAQIQNCHVSAIGNGSWNLSWNSLDIPQQEALATAGLSAGYRYLPKDISLTLNGSFLEVTATWINQGSAPTYRNWNVQYFLYNKATNASVSQLTSSLSLKTLLPTTSHGACNTLDSAETPSGTDRTLTEALSLSSVPAGSYELRVKVVDAVGYLSPMALALPTQNSDGSYTLGDWNIP